MNETEDDSKRTIPKHKNLEVVAKLTGVPVSELLGEEVIKKIEEYPVTYNIDHVTIKQYDTGGSMGDTGIILRDQAGIIEEFKVSQEWLQKNVRGCSSPKNLAIVTGFGSSMKPLFNAGDPLIVDTGYKSVDVDAVYFFRVGDEGFVKILQRIPTVGIRVISKNPDYETWTITEDMDFEVFGRVNKAWASEDL